MADTADDLVERLPVTAWLLFYGGDNKQLSFVMPDDANCAVALYDEVRVRRAITAAGEREKGLREALNDAECDLTAARAENERLRQRLRKRAIFGASHLMACGECGHEWQYNQPERHAKDCLAALPEGATE